MDIKRLGLIPSILLISLVLLSCGGKSIEQKLIGKWYGTDPGSIVPSLGTFILKKDNTFQVFITDRFGNVTIFPPSKEELEQENTVLESMSWRVGENVFTEKRELTLLISLTNTESGEIRNVEREYGFNFIDENNIEFKLDYEKIILTRQ